jgi:hypothetical protein
MSVSIREDGEGQWLVKFSWGYLSYPHIFEPYRAKKPQLDPATGKPKPGKFGAKFCFPRADKETSAIGKAVYEKCVEMAKTKWKQGLAADRYCIRDGRQLEEDMNPYFVLSASESTAPIAVDRRRNPVKAEDELFYAGCKVIGTIRLWAQDHLEYGKRINANFIGVQFYEHSERWGGRTRLKADELFDDISEQFGGEDEYETVPEESTAAVGQDNDSFGDDDGL